MAETENSAGSGFSLSKKLYGIPTWGWLAIAAAGGVAALVWMQSRKKAATPATTANSGPTYADGIPTEQYESLLALLRDIQGQGSTSTTPPPSGGTGNLTAPGGVTDLGNNRIGWNAVPNAVGYRIYQAGGALLDAGTGTYYNISGLTKGGKYGYQVAAVDANGNEGPKSPVTYVQGA